MMRFMSPDWALTNEVNTVAFPIAILPLLQSTAVMSLGQMDSALYPGMGPNR